MTFKEGEILDLYKKGTRIKLGEVIVKRDCCHKILARQILFMLGYEKSEYDVRKKI